MSHSRPFIISYGEQISVWESFHMEFGGNYLPFLPSYNIGQRTVGTISSLYWEMSLHVH